MKKVMSQYYRNFNIFQNIQGALFEILITLYRRNGIDAYYQNGDDIYFGRETDKKPKPSEDVIFKLKGRKYMIGEIKKSLVLVKDADALGRIAKISRQPIVQKLNTTTVENKEFFSKIFFVDAEGIIYLLIPSKVKFDIKNCKSTFYMSKSLKL